MPKNVVGRLLNLENEMKNVLSICELSKTKEKSRKPDQKTGKILTRSSFSHVEHKRPSSVKTVNRQPFPAKEKPVEKHKQKEKTSICLRSKPLMQKPNSAPSNALSTIKEVENYTVAKHPVQRVPNAGGVGSVDSAEWFDCSQQVCETSEQTLRPAEQILTDIALYGTENFVPKHSITSCRSCHETLSDCICQDKQEESVGDDIEREKESFLQSIKPDLRENRIINELAKKIEKKELEVMSAKRESHRKSPRRIVNEPQKMTKTLNETSEDNKQSRELKNKSVQDSTKRQTITSKYKGRPMTAPILSRKSDMHPPKQEEISKNPHDGDDEMKENSAEAEEFEEIEKNKVNEGEINNLTENRNHQSVYAFANIRNSVQWIKHAVFDKESLLDEKSSEKQIQELINSNENKDFSEETNRKLIEIIEKNKAKMEKMKRSRHVAVHTIKYIKEKYDILTEIKNDLAEKLELVIKSNRLRTRQQLKGRPNRRSSQMERPAMNG